MIAATCLALAIYFEAGTEPYIGKLATGWAVVNSQKLTKRTTCSEVFSGRYFGPLRYTRGDKPHGHSWKVSQAIAKGILEGKLADPTGGATNFECMYPRFCSVLPKWSIGMEYRGIYGHQFFFKRKR